MRRAGPEAGYAASQPHALHSGLAVIVGALLIASPCAQAQVVKQDFYYFRGQPVDLSVHLDSLGVVARHGASPADVEVALLPFELSIARELGGDLYLVGLVEPLSRDSLLTIAGTLRGLDSDAIQDAGFVVRITDAGIPVFVNDQFVVRFRRGVGKAQIEQLNQANHVEVVTETVFETNHFLLRVTPQSDVDALKMGNRYAESPLTQYAHANFVGGALPTILLDKGYAALQNVSVRAGREPSPVGALAPSPGASTLPQHIPNDPLFPQQWHLHNASGADVEAPLAWEITRGQREIVIAAIEMTGFDLAHPDLSGNLWQNAGETAANGVDDDGNAYIDDTHGWNFTGCTASQPPGCGTANLSDDPRHHGTAAAGLIAAQGDNSIGVSGICAQCRLMLLRVGMQDFAQASAFRYAREMGAYVINNSWNKSFITDDLENAIGDAAEDGRSGLGSVVVFGMWNDPGNYCTGSLQDLASLPTVIAVSGSNDKDERVGFAWGDCMDLLSPAAMSPKLLGMATTDAMGTLGYNLEPNIVMPNACPRTEPVDGDYTYCFGGTSAGAPIVSGIAGLILSVDPTRTRQQVQEILQQTAEKIEADVAAYDASGFSLTHGYGRVNAFLAVSRAAKDGQEEIFEPRFELGARLGFAYLSDSEDVAKGNIPGGGPLGEPVIYVALFPDGYPSWMIDLQLGFSFEDVEGPQPSRTNLVSALQPSYLVSGSTRSSLYFGPSLAFQLVDVGGSSSTDEAFGVALGYRALVRPFFALRFEGRYRYWIDQAITETGVAFAFGVVVD